MKILKALEITFGPLSYSIEEATKNLDNQENWISKRFDLKVLLLSRPEVGWITNRFGKLRGSIIIQFNSKLFELCRLLK
jgi:hypothetical protein